VVDVFKVKPMAIEKNNPALNASGSPEGWQCESYSSCYNVDATVICLDVRPN